MGSFLFSGDTQGAVPAAPDRDVPHVVRARISTFWAEAPGSDEASRSLCTWPAAALTSRYAAVPSATPTSRSPIAVSSTTEPRTTSRRRTSPFADFATVVPRARSTTIGPLAALTFRSPPATPIHVSPLEFFTTALASSSRRRTSPVAVVTSTLRRARSTVMSPAPLFTLSESTPSRRTLPTPVRIRHVSELAVACEVRGARGAVQAGAGGHLDRRCRSSHRRAGSATSAASGPSR